MAWHRLTHKQTGEVAIVASLAGYDLDQWQVLKLKANRAPGEFQAVQDDGSIATDTALRDAARRRAVIGTTDPIELHEKLLAEIEALKARLDRGGL